MTNMDLHTDRLSLKQMRAGLDGRLLLAIGVGNGSHARILHQLIYEMQDQGKIPDFIGGFIFYCSGYLCAADLGLPDMGYILRHEMEHQTHVIDQSTWMASLENRRPAFPICSDIDTGYGNEPSSVILSCRQMHKQGAQLLQIEDQFNINKSCGHMAGPLGKGKAIIPAEEMIARRIGPAVAYARAQDDLMIMARTDAVAVDGLDAGLARARAFSEAGADILFVEAPQGDKELRRVAEALKDVPSLVTANMIEGSPETPFKSPEELHKMGFDMVIYCIGASLSTRAPLEQYYGALLAGGDPTKVMSGSSPDTWFDRFNDMIGRKQTEAWNTRFN